MTYIIVLLCGMDMFNPLDIKFFVFLEEWARKRKRYF